ncbi:type I methionyl aminopeptidase [Candidatus Saccharibacteria bacterium]|nr:type I methionyl aminopeptidase [Candidatus Saccharibacteria bacterium]
MSIKTQSEIEKMRISGRILANTLKILTEMAVEGITPKDLAKVAASELKRNGATATFLGYGGTPPYPDVICISVNDQVQHSVPTNIPLKNGDIVNFDFGVTYDGLVTDSGVTICVGGVPNQSQRRLLEGTKQALYDAISIIKPGIKVGDISSTIEKTLRKYKLGIVKELVGHGVGHELHEDLEVPNYGKAGTGPVLKPGMTIAVEPITTLGKPDIYQDNDGWTLRTWDGSLSAQFEHTILITENGCEVLTAL